MVKQQVFKSRGLLIKTHEKFNLSNQDVSLAYKATNIWKISSSNVDCVTIAF